LWWWLCWPGSSGDELVFGFEGRVLGRRLVSGLGADLCRMTEVVLFLGIRVERRAGELVLQFSYSISRSRITTYSWDYMYFGRDDV
jgi:hypothetical protein